MLPLSELSDRLVRRGAWFSPYNGVNVPLVAHAARIGVSGAPGMPERSQAAHALVTLWVPSSDPAGGPRASGLAVDRVHDGGRHHQHRGQARSDDEGHPQPAILGRSTKEALSNADGLAFVDEMPVRGRTTGIRIWSLAGDETDESGARPATRPESEPVGGSPAPGAGAVP
jgi:hypothetical protein